MYCKELRTVHVVSNVVSVICNVHTRIVGSVPGAIEVDAADVAEHHDLVGEHFGAVAAVVLALDTSRVHRARRIARLALHGRQVRLHLLEEVRLRMDAGRRAPPVSARQVRSQFCQKQRIRYCKFIQYCNNTNSTGQVVMPQD